MNACEWTLFLNALALAIAREKSVDELAFLSLIFSQLSANLALLSTTPPNCPSKQPSPSPTDPDEEAVLSVK